MFHHHWREQALSRLGDTFDLIVIGGGITGAGILLDAAQRGLRTLLVEREDIASGTSSRSSKLIHGGLRYLKQMQFRVTRLACRERDRMMVLSPHLVHPVRFLYPAREGDRMPGWTVALGLWMYDQLTSRPEKHTDVPADEVSHAAPGLTLDGLERTLAYGDALADDALLTLAVAATGFAYGGLVLTRAEVLEALKEPGGKIRGVVLRDLERDRRHEVRAHLVVNAAGVWVDRLRSAFGIGGRRLRPARGSHIVLPVGRLPLRAAVAIASPDDGRPVFLVPHPEGILVGTTDIYHDESLDDPRATSAEVHYLLGAVQAHFPERRVAEGDIVGVFSGVRPILYTATDNPSAASREEDIWVEDGMMSVAGGKLTTWRHIAEQAVDGALEHLPEERTRAVAACHTRGTPLVGLCPRDLEERLRHERMLSAPIARALARRLGAGAWWALRMARGESETDPLLDGTDLSAAEVRAHLSFGAVLHLDDLLLRRARLGLWNPALASELVPRLRPLFAQEMGWDGPRWDRECEAFGRALEGWSPAGVR